MKVDLVNTAQLADLIPADSTPPADPRAFERALSESRGASEEATVRSRRDGSSESSPAAETEGADRRAESVVDESDAQNAAASTTSDSTPLATETATSAAPSAPGTLSPGQPGVGDASSGTSVPGELPSSAAVPLAPSAPLTALAGDAAASTPASLVGAALVGESAAALAAQSAASTLPAPGTDAAASVATGAAAPVDITLVEEAQATGVPVVTAPAREPGATPNVAPVTGGDALASSQLASSQLAAAGADSGGAGDGDSAADDGPGFHLLDGGEAEEPQPRNERAITSKQSDMTAAERASARQASPVAPGAQGENFVAARAAASEAAPSVSANHSGSTVVRGVMDAPLRSESVAANATVVRADRGDASELAEKIYRVVRRAVRRGSGDLHVRITPPKLGRVDVNVQVSDELLKVRLQVTSEEVKAVLQQNLDDLHETLRSYGFDAQEVSVDLHSATSDDSAPDEPSGSAAAAARAEQELFDDPDIQVIETRNLGSVLDRRG